MHRPLPLAAAFLGLWTAIGACGPKSGGVDSGTPAPAPSPSAPSGPRAWHAEARILLELGLGGARTIWNDPAILPGERVRWVVTSEAFPDRFLEVRLAEGGGGAQRWAFVAGPPRAPRRTLELFRYEGPIDTLAISGADLPRVETTDAREIAAFMPAGVLGSASEATFVAAGGAFLGNEVVRVPAGEFRARHALLASGGRNWHLYVVRAVPGGFAKVEMFPEGSVEPALVMELDDFTRLPRRGAGE